jgi:hypothetical protein
MWLPLTGGAAEAIVDEERNRVMETKAVRAIYRNGSLRLTRKLPLPNNTVVILSWRRPTNAVEATQGIIRIPRRVVLELTTPHKYSVWDL